MRIKNKKILIFLLSLQQLFLPFLNFDRISTARAAAYPETRSFILARGFFVNTEDEFIGMAVEGERDFLLKLKIALAARNEAAKGALWSLKYLAGLYRSVLARYFAEAMPLPSSINKKILEFKKIDASLPFELNRAVPDSVWSFLPEIGKLRDGIFNTLEDTDSLLPEGKDIVATVAENSLAYLNNEIQIYSISREINHIKNRLKWGEDRENTLVWYQAPGAVYKVRFKDPDKRGLVAKLAGLETSLQYLNFTSETAHKFHKYLEIPFDDRGSIKSLLTGDVGVKYNLYHLMAAVYLSYFPDALKLLGIRCCMGDDSTAEILADRIRVLDRRLHGSKVPSSVYLRARKAADKYLKVDFNGALSKVSNTKCGKLGVDGLKARWALIVLSMLKRSIEEHLSYLSMLSSADPKDAFEMLKSKDPYKAGIGRSILKKVLKGLLPVFVSADMGQLVWERVIGPSNCMQRSTFDRLVTEMRKELFKSLDSGVEKLLRITATAATVGFFVTFFIPGAQGISYVLFLVSMGAGLAASTLAYTRARPVFDAAFVYWNPLGDPAEISKLPAVGLAEYRHYSSMERSLWGGIYSTAFWIGVESLFIVARLSQLIKFTSKGVLFDKKGLIDMFRQSKSITPAKVISLYKSKTFWGRRMLDARYIAATALLLYFVSNAAVSAARPTKEKIAYNALVQNRKYTEKLLKRDETRHLLGKRASELLSILREIDEKNEADDFYPYYSKMLNVLSPYYSGLVPYDGQKTVLLSGRIFINTDKLMQASYQELASEICARYFDTYSAPSNLVEKMLEDRRLDHIDAYLEDTGVDSSKVSSEDEEINMLQDMLSDLKAREYYYQIYIEREKFVKRCAEIAADF